MKILLLSNGMKFQTALFGKALQEYFDEVTATGVLSNTVYEYGFDKEAFEGIFVPPNQITDVDKFDVIMGLDQGTIPMLSKLKKATPDKIMGVQILDYPKHVFKKNKNYNERANDMWKRFMYFKNEFLVPLDFFAHNQMIALEEFREVLPNNLSEFVRYPINPIEFENIKRENIIVYSGRIHPDKGVHNVISALGLIEEKCTFVTIGGGFDFTPLAEHLGVSYVNMTDCSESKKWELYHKCKFLVSGADNPYIPTLCILEGISVGRAGICFDYKENKIHYKEFAWYCVPNSIQSLANCIKQMLNDPVLCDDRAKKGKDFYKEELTYNKWAENIWQIIKKLQ